MSELKQMSGYILTCFHDTGGNGVPDMATECLMRICDSRDLVDDGEDFGEIIAVTIGSDRFVTMFLTPDEARLFSTGLLALLNKINEGE